MDGHADFEAPSDERLAVGESGGEVESFVGAPLAGGYADGACTVPRGGFRSGNLSFREPLAKEGADGAAAVGDGNGAGSGH